MKSKTLIITAVVVAAAGIGAWNIGSSYAHGSFGPGGQGGKGGYGHGYSMMQSQGHGMGHGMGHGNMQGKGPGSQNCDYGQNQTLETPLTIDDVRANLEQKLQWRGNDRLKVGSVVEKDDKTIVAEIVTVDDSLVRKVEIDKATGRHEPVK
ncbi:MAG: hypothetical protein JKY27_08575 [Magnetovibrio sp.]|nr:hypothetical protein [Magnetovibrio sp.]